MERALREAHATHAAALQAERSAAAAAAVSAKAALEEALSARQALQGELAAAQGAHAAEIARSRAELAAETERASERKGRRLLKRGGSEHAARVRHDVYLVVVSGGLLRSVLRGWSERGVSHRLSAGNEVHCC